MEAMSRDAELCIQYATYSRTDMTLIYQSFMQNWAHACLIENPNLEPV